MRELVRTRALLTGVIGAAALLGASPVWASHDAACQLMGTGAQRAKSVSCNPRQNCFNATPGNPACNAAPTSGECPAGMETYNPRQECVAKLPQMPAVSITRVEGGAAGENRTYAGRPDVLRVQGQNVGMPGNTVAGDAGLIVSLVPAPNCGAPGCVGLAVQSQPNTEGVRRFQVRAGHGHSQAEATVQVVAAPPVQAPPLPQVTMPKQPAKPPEKMYATPSAPTPIPIPYPVMPSQQPVAPAVPKIEVPGRVTTSSGKLAAPFAVPAVFSSPIGVDHDRNKGRNDLDCRNYQGHSFPTCYDNHEGSDFMMAGGFATMDAGSFTVIAAASGLVTDVASGKFDRCHYDPREPDHINCQGGGPEEHNFVEIRQDDGLIARYLHLKRDSVLVRKDQRVACGQPLGKVGSSGRSSAPHLHFDLTRGGQIVDPYAERLWISVDARNVPNGPCPGVTATPLQLKR